MEWLLAGKCLQPIKHLEWGVINRTIPKELLIEETERFARKLAAKPPLSLGIDQGIGA